MQNAAPQRKAWAASVEKLSALGATTVVGGHQKPGTQNDTSTLTFTRNYLASVESDIPSSKNSTELTAKLHKQFPDTIDVLDNFILGNSSKVMMGEEGIWQE